MNHPCLFRALLLPLALLVQHKKTAVLHHQFLAFRAERIGPAYPFIPISVLLKVGIFYDQIRQLLLIPCHKKWMPIHDIQKTVIRE